MKTYLFVLNLILSMGILDLSPTNVKIVRDVIIIGVFGAIVVISLAFAIDSLQQSLTFVIPK
jgi:hypothetical protein